MGTSMENLLFKTDHAPPACCRPRATPARAVSPTPRLRSLCVDFDLLAKGGLGQARRGLRGDWRGLADDAKRRTIKGKGGRDRGAARAPAAIGSVAHNSGGQGNIHFRVWLRTEGESMQHGKCGNVRMTTLHVCALEIDFAVQRRDLLAGARSCLCATVGTTEADAHGGCVHYRLGSGLVNCLGFHHCALDQLFIVIVPDIPIVGRWTNECWRFLQSYQITDHRNVGHECTRSTKNPARTSTTVVH